MNDGRTGGRATRTAALHTETGGNLTSSPLARPRTRPAYQCWTEDSKGAHRVHGSREGVQAYIHACPSRWLADTHTHRVGRHPHNPPTRCFSTPPLPQWWDLRSSALEQRSTKSETRCGEARGAKSTRTTLLPTKVSRRAPTPPRSTPTTLRPLRPRQCPSSSMPLLLPRPRTLLASCDPTLRPFNGAGESIDFVPVHTWLAGGGGGGGGVCCPLAVALVAHNKTFHSSRKTGEKYQRYITNRTGVRRRQRASGDSPPSPSRTRRGEEASPRDGGRLDPPPRRAGPSQAGRQEGRNPRRQPYIHSIAGIKKSGRPLEGSAS